MSVHPASAPMLRTVMEYVATLTQRRELVERAVTRIMVEVRAGQHHRRPSTLRQDVFCRSSCAPPLPVAPAMPFPVPPSSVPEMEYFLPMGAPAMLASAPCPHKANMVGELRPVDRVQKHVLGSDRHQASPSEAPGCGAPSITEPALQRSAPGRAWHDDT